MNSNQNDDNGSSKSNASTSKPNITKPYKIFTSKNSAHASLMCNKTPVGIEKELSEPEKTEECSNSEDYETIVTSQSYPKILEGISSDSSVETLRDCKIDRLGSVSTINPLEFFERKGSQINSAAHVLKSIANDKDKRWNDPLPATQKSSSLVSTLSEPSLDLVNTEKMTSTPVANFVCQSNDNKKFEIKGNLNLAEISTIKKEHRITRPFLGGFRKDQNNSVVSPPISPKMKLSIQSPDQVNHPALKSTNTDKVENCDELSTPQNVENSKTVVSTANQISELYETNNSSSEDEIMIIEDDGNLSRVVTDTLDSLKPTNANGNVILSEYKQHVISEHDYKTLEYEEFLNDNVVDFYLCYLQHEKLDSEKYNDIHVYSSHFFARLKGSTAFVIKDKAKRVKQEEEEYLRVKNWTRKINIFSKYMLIIPVCEDEHWYLIIVCNPGLVGKRTEDYQEKSLVPSIMVLDSLGSSHKKSVERIRSYLTYEYFERFKLPQSFKDSDIKLNVPVVPHQPNSCDCGIYLLHYVEKIFQSLNLFLTNDMPNLATWFRNSIDIVPKRYNIAKIIQSMAIHKEEVNQDGEKINPISLFPHLNFEKLRPNSRVKNEEVVNDSKDGNKLYRSSEDENLSTDQESYIEDEKPATDVFESSSEAKEYISNKKINSDKYLENDFQLSTKPRKKRIVTIKKTVFEKEHDRAFFSDSSGYDRSDNQRFWGRLNIVKPTLMRRVERSFKETHKCENEKTSNNEQEHVQSDRSSMIFGENTMKINQTYTSSLSLSKGYKIPKKVKSTGINHNIDDKSLEITIKGSNAMVPNEHHKKFQLAKDNNDIRDI